MLSFSVSSKLQKNRNTPLYSTLQLQKESGILHFNLAENNVLMLLIQPYNIYINVAITK